MKTVLVMGGAGYIGSHACKLLSESGYLPATFDNLSTGWAQAVKFGPFEQGGTSGVFNLGTGHGFSVREVADQVANTTKLPISVIEGPRRGGDCAKLVPGSSRATEELGWQPEFSKLDQMIAHAWLWHQTTGYEN